MAEANNIEIIQEHPSEFGYLFFPSSQLSSLVQRSTTEYSHWAAANVGVPYSHGAKELNWTVTASSLSSFSASSKPVLTVIRVESVRMAFGGDIDIDDVSEGSESFLQRWKIIPRLLGSWWSGGGNSDIDWDAVRMSSSSFSGYYDNRSDFLNAFSFGIVILIRLKISGSIQDTLLTLHLQAIFTLVNLRPSSTPFSTPFSRPPPPTWGLSVRQRCSPFFKVVKKSSSFFDILSGSLRRKRWMVVFAR